MSILDEQIKALQEENAALRQRAEAAEKKLADIKESLTADCRHDESELGKMQQQLEQRPDEMTMQKPQFRGPGCRIPPPIL